MDSARISALLEPFLSEGRPPSRGVRDVGSTDAGTRDIGSPSASLSSTQLEQISTYIDLLLRWNARINLTAIRDPEEIVPRHFGESFFLARHIFPAAEPKTEAAGSHEARSSKPVHVVDLGSGAGFPALPIKIWAPQIHLTMIESNHKKATFLREAARALTLTNVDVIAERAEVVADRLQRPQDQAASPAAGSAVAPFAPADVVTFRAVEKFHQVLPLATKFLAPGATLAILISESQQDQLQTINRIGWTRKHIPLSYQRVLALGKS
jgi:16S rRNA (guanine(527)-N(7))-methyltransferase RsmG